MRRLPNRWKNSLNSKQMLNCMAWFGFTYGLMIFSYITQSTLRPQCDKSGQNHNALDNLQYVKWMFNLLCTDVPVPIPTLPKLTLHVLPPRSTWERGTRSRSCRPFSRRGSAAQPPTAIRAPEWWESSTESCCKWASRDQLAPYNVDAYVPSVSVYEWFILPLSQRQRKHQRHCWICQGDGPDCARQAWGFLLRG